MGQARERINEYTEAGPRAQKAGPVFRWVEYNMSAKNRATVIPPKNDAAPFMHREAKNRLAGLARRFFVVRAKGDALTLLDAIFRDLFTVCSGPALGCENKAPRVWYCVMERQGAGTRN